MVYHCSVPAQTQMWDLVEHPIKRVNACGLCCAPVWSLVILLYCDSNLFPMQTINNTRQSGCAHVMWKFNDQMIKVHAMYIYLCFPISIAIEIEVIVAFASCCPSFFFAMFASKLLLSQPVHAKNAQGIVMPCFSLRILEGYI